MNEHKFPAPEGCEGMEKETEIVYDFLDRDYTANATKEDSFWGDDTQFYAPRHQAAKLLAWFSQMPDAPKISRKETDLLIRANGYLVQTLSERFDSGMLHTLVYSQPNTMQCPETAKAVIQAMHASNRTEFCERDRDYLRPYKRYPVIIFDHINAIPSNLSKSVVRQTRLATTNPARWRRNATETLRRAGNF